MRTGRGVFFVLQTRLTHSRHQQSISIIRNSGSVEVSAREPVNYIIGVMIARATFPTSVNSGVRGELNHPERSCSSGKGMPGSVCPDHGVYVFIIVLSKSTKIPEYKK